jgi:hypothetical protein
MKLIGIKENKNLQTIKHTGGRLNKSNGVNIFLAIYSALHDKDVKKDDFSLKDEKAKIEINKMKAYNKKHDFDKLLKKYKIQLLTNDDILNGELNPECKGYITKVPNERNYLPVFKKTQKGGNCPISQQMNLEDFLTQCKNENKNEQCMQQLKKQCDITCKCENTDNINQCVQKLRDCNKKEPAPVQAATTPVQPPAPAPAPESPVKAATITEQKINLCHKIIKDEAIFQNIINQLAPELLAPEQLADNNRWTKLEKLVQKYQTFFGVTENITTFKVLLKGWFQKKKGDTMEILEFARSIMTVHEIDDDNYQDAIYNHLENILPCESLLNSLLSLHFLTTGVNNMRGGTRRSARGAAEEAAAEEAAAVEAAADVAATEEAAAATAAADVAAARTWKDDWSNKDIDDLFDVPEFRGAFFEGVCLAEVNKKPNISFKKVFQSAFIVIIFSMFMALVGAYNSHYVFQQLKLTSGEAKNIGTYEQSNMISLIKKQAETMNLCFIGNEETPKKQWFAKNYPKPSYCLSPIACSKIPMTYDIEHPKTKTDLISDDLVHFRTMFELWVDVVYRNPSIEPPNNPPNKPQSIKPQTDFFNNFNQGELPLSTAYVQYINNNTISDLINGFNNFLTTPEEGSTEEGSTKLKTLNKFRKEYQQQSSATESYTLQVSEYTWSIIFDIRAGYQNIANRHLKLYSNYVPIIRDLFDMYIYENYENIERTSEEIAKANLEAAAAATKYVTDNENYQFFKLFADILYILEERTPDTHPNTQGQVKEKLERALQILTKISPQAKVMVENIMLQNQYKAYTSGLYKTIQLYGDVASTAAETVIGEITPENLKSTAQIATTQLLDISSIMVKSIHENILTTSDKITLNYIATTQLSNLVYKLFKDQLSELTKDTLLSAKVLTDVLKPLTFIANAYDKQQAGEFERILRSSMLTLHAKTTILRSKMESSVVDSYNLFKALYDLYQTKGGDNASSIMDIGIKYSKDYLKLAIEMNKLEIAMILMHLQNNFVKGFSEGTPIYHGNNIRLYDETDDKALSIFAVYHADVGIYATKLLPRITMLSALLMMDSQKALELMM